MGHGKHSKTIAKPAIDRRSGRDRRRAENDPPGVRDRRVGIEPRRPEVVEIDVTASEWDSLREQVQPEKKTG